MKKMFLLAAGVLVLSGCGAATLDNGGSSETQSEEKAASELTVGVSISTLNNPFFVSMQEGINQLAEENDTDVRFVDAQDDTAKQSNDIDDLIQQGVDVLLINPVDSAAIVPAVEAAGAGPGRQRWQACGAVAMEPANQPAYQAGGGR